MTASPKCASNWSDMSRRMMDRRIGRPKSGETGTREAFTISWMLHIPAALRLGMRLLRLCYDRGYR